MDWISIVSEIIIPIVGLLLTVLVAPRLRVWLAKKAETEQEARWQELARTSVEAAEQIFKAESGDVKFEYARGLLVATGISEEDAERLIESAVYAIKQFSAEANEKE